MKYRNILLNLCLLSLSSGFVACSSESVWGEPEPETPGKDEVVEIDVKMADFDVTGDKDETRSTQSGNDVNFESGDAIGITIYNGSTIIANNVKVTYDGSKWTAASKLDGVGAQYYAYYPYDASCSGVKTDAALKTKLPVTADQSTKELYKKCDIMSATGTGAAKISISLKHVRSCISVDSFQKTLVYNEMGDIKIIGSENYESNSTINVQNTAHNKIVGNFYKGEDGDYRCIVEAGTGQAYDLCITPNGGTLSSSALSNGSTTYVAGKRYHHALGGQRTYSWQDMGIGSYVGVKNVNGKAEYYVNPGGSWQRTSGHVEWLGEVVGFTRESNKVHLWLRTFPYLWTELGYKGVFVHNHPGWKVELATNDLLYDLDRVETGAQFAPKQDDGNRNGYSTFAYALTKLNQKSAKYAELEQWGVAVYKDMMTCANLANLIFDAYYVLLREEGRTVWINADNARWSSYKLNLLNKSVSIYKASQSGLASYDLADAGIFDEAIFTIMDITY